VVIDYGTGYYVERSTDQAMKFCDRKIKFLKKNADKVREMIQAKSKTMEEVQQVF
jgi:prefoldin alpha subunit